MKPIYALILSGCFSLFLNSACVSRQATPEQAPWVSSQVMKDNARAFIQALFAHEIEDVVRRSQFPFYFNHQAVLSAPHEWRDALRQMTLSTQPANVQVLSLEPYALNRLREEKPEVWGMLVEHRFDIQIYLLARIQIEVPGKPVMQENVLLLLHPENGKVMGFVG